MIKSIWAYIALAFFAVLALLKRENKAKKEAQEAVADHKEEIQELNKSMDIQTDLDKHLQNRREILARNNKIRLDNLQTLKDLTNDENNPDNNPTTLIASLTKLLNSKDKN